MQKNGFPDYFLFGLMDGRGDRDGTGRYFIKALCRILIKFSLTLILRLTTRGDFEIYQSLLSAAP